MELAGLIKKSSFVIANDTGPAHIAVAHGITNIVIFGVTNHLKFGPFDPMHT